MTQSFEDYEIVIVNDGSTDDSLRICEDYQRRYPKKQITIVSQENSGLLMARRVGFANACGEYVWPIDSDDMIRTDALMTINEVIAQTNCDMVFFEYSLSREYAAKGSTCFSESGYFDSTNKDRLIRAYCDGLIYPLATKVIRKDCLCLGRDYGSYAGLSNGEDEIQVIDILNAIQSAAYIMEPLYYYRQNAESITGLYRKGVLLEHDLVMEAQVAAIEKWLKTYQDSSLRRAYKEAKLRNLYFNCRKSLNWKNRTILLDELRSIKYYKFLFEGSLELRADQKIFYSLVNRRRDTAVFLVCLITRFVSRIKTGRFEI